MWRHLWGIHVPNFTQVVQEIWMVGHKFMYSLIWRPGQHSLHGYSLQGIRSGDRIPEGARFSAPVQTDLRGPPSPLYNRWRVMPGGKAAGACVDHPSPSSANVPERVELHLHFPCVFSWPAPGQTCLLQPYVMYGYHRTVVRKFKLFLQRLINNSVSIVWWWVYGLYPSSKE
jgi:hypothetical protein